MRSRWTFGCVNYAKHYSLSLRFGIHWIVSITIDFYAQTCCIFIVQSPFPHIQLMEVDWILMVEVAVTPRYAEDESNYCLHHGAILARLHLMIAWVLFLCLMWHRSFEEGVRECSRKTIFRPGQRKSRECDAVAPVVANVNSFCVTVVVNRGIQFIPHISTRNEKLYFAFFGSAKQKRSEPGREMAWDVEWIFITARWIPAPLNWSGAFFSTQMLWKSFPRVCSWGS